MGRVNTMTSLKLSAILSLYTNPVKDPKMTIQELYQRFSTGFNYNAALYFIYKVASTGITLALYNRFDCLTFSLYGNINSIIFLILLWLDFGLQKTVPRFCLDYATNNRNLYSFMHKLLLFKIAVLLTAIPIYIWLTNNFAITAGLKNINTIFYIGALLLITEGIVSIIRLIYHAYFLHRIFNSLNALTISIEVLISVIGILTIKDDIQVVVMLLCSKALTNSILITLTFKNISTVYTQITSKEQGRSSEGQIDKQFIKHAAIMYFNNSTKSLSERNFLFPLFTITFGALSANMFKVALDGALLFYRIVVKAIGTTDTALFAHLLHINKKDETWQIAFKKLCTKISALVIPLAAIIYIIYRYKLFNSYNPFVFQLFLIITMCLLTEIIFSPYERMLEVNRNYWLLACAYTPYLLVMSILLLTNIMTSIGMLDTVLIIHAVRLVSVLIMVCITRIYYRLHYPIRSLLFIIGIIILGVMISIYTIDTIIASPLFPFL